MLRDGEDRDQSELARLANVTQPRMTQILNLLHLAPSIREEILHLPRVTKGKAPIHEMMLRPIAAEVDWGGRGKGGPELRISVRRRDGGTRQGSTPCPQEARILRLRLQEWLRPHRSQARQGLSHRTGWAAGTVLGGCIGFKTSPVSTHTGCVPAQSPAPSTFRACGSSCPPSTVQTRAWFSVRRSSALRSPLVSPCTRRFPRS